MCVCACVYIHIYIYICGSLKAPPFTDSCSLDEALRVADAERAAQLTELARGAAELQEARKGAAGAGLGICMKALIGGKGRQLFKGQAV